MEQGAEVSLQGYRLDRIDPGTLTLDGFPVQIVSADSALLRFSAPVLSQAACVGGGLEAVELAGGTLLGRISIRVLRDDEVNLAPGDWMVLGDAPEQCLRLHPGVNGAYTLLMMDARSLQGALTAPEDRMRPFTTFGMELEDRTVAGGGNAAPRVAATAIASWTAPPRPDFELLSRNRVPDPAGPPPPDYYRYRDEPWQVGDRLTVDKPLEGGEYVPATIVRNYRDRFVVAVLDQDEEYRVADRLDSMDVAMDVVFDYGIPLLRSSLGDAYPVTTAASDQLLIIVSEYDLIGAIMTCGGANSPDRFPGSCVMKLSPGIAIDDLDVPLFIRPDLLTHELAHAWQSLHLDLACRDAGECGGPGADRWASEGGADFLAIEAMRQRQGSSFDQNSSWHDYSWDAPGTRGDAVHRLLEFRSRLREQ